MFIPPRLDSVAMTAAFLYAGMNRYPDFGLLYTRFAESGGGGQIELVDALTSYAPLIASMFDNEKRNFPGVFHYEVTEPFGAWFAESLHATGKLPDSAVGVEKLREMIEVYFAQGVNHG